MPEEPYGKEITVAFYRTEMGSEPVREWLLSMSKADRVAIGADIKTLEFGWPLGMPVCRAMRDGLFEVRTRLDGNRHSRVFFCVHAKHLVLLHGFIKKERATPKKELDLANRRKSEVEYEQRK